MLRGRRFGGGHSVPDIVDDRSSRLGGGLLALSFLVENLPDPCRALTGFIESKRELRCISKADPLANLRAKQAPVFLEDRERFL